MLEEYTGITVDSAPSGNLVGLGIIQEESANDPKRLHCFNAWFSMVNSRLWVEACKRVVITDYWERILRYCFELI